MGTQLPYAQKAGRAPQFLAHVYCGQTARWTKMPLGAEVGLGPGHIVLDGNPAPPPLKGYSPQFSAHICCGQMAGWIKTPLRMEIGLDQSNNVRWGPTSPSPKRGRIAQFSARVYCSQTVAHLSYRWTLAYVSIMGFSRCYKTTVFLHLLVSISVLRTQDKRYGCL